MEYLIHILILVAIYGIVALSLNLVVGEAGLLSVTQAAFYGIGAYATALLLLNYGFNFFLAALVGMLLSGVVAVLLGIVFSRLAGDYYALGSFGFNVIVYSIMLNWQSVTQGPLGIPGIPRPIAFGFQFSDNLSFLLLCVVALALVYALCVFITKSSFGRVLRAIREDEAAISVFGYEVGYYKLVVFTVSAMLAALAGSLFASYITYIDPSSFILNVSILVLSMVILGGLGSNRGAVLGAAILIILPEALRFAGFPDDIAAQMHQAIYGAILILLMLFRPQGLLGTFRL
jgi:branched-chain amino acid transport system permease protein